MNEVDEFSFTELKDEFEEILNISDMTAYHLQHEKMGPRIIQAYRKLRSDKSRTDGYNILLMRYARSPFRDLESYRRFVVGLDEEDIRLILKQFNKKIVTVELSPGIYSIKDIADIAKVVNTRGDQEGTLEKEYDKITKKTNLFLKRFGSNFGSVRFDERSFFNTFLGFTPYWDYKPANAIHADSSGVYISVKF